MKEVTLQDFDSIFGALRPLVHAPEKESDWRREAIELLEASFSCAPSRHMEETIPYLAGFEKVWHRPLLELVSPEELEYWGRIAPFARLELMLSSIC